MSVVSNFRNDLLKRKEVEIIVEAGSNPGFEGAKEMIVKEFKANEDGIVVRGVKSEFGKKEFLIDAFIYDSKKDLEKIEPKSKKVESTPESAPAEAPTGVPPSDESGKGDKEVKEEKTEEATE